MEADYLTHYGVKGMRWGVRRERESKGGSSGLKNPFKKEPPSKDAAQAKALQKRIKKNGLDNLTNEELQALTKRMQLTQNYKNLANPKKQQNAGAKFVKEVLETEAKNYVRPYVAKGIAKGARKLKKAIDEERRMARRGW